MNSGPAKYKRICDVGARRGTGPPAFLAVWADRHAPTVGRCPGPYGHQDSYLKESDTRVRNAVTFPFSTFISASRQGPPHRIFPATVGPLGLSDLHHDRNENDQQDDYDGPKDYAINLRLEELLKTLHFFLISLTVPSREPRRVLASGRGSLARRNRGERGAATTTSPRKRVFRVIGTGGSLGAASLSGVRRIKRIAAPRRRKAE
jgi:hypothetical protein